MNEDQDDSDLRQDEDSEERTNSSQSEPVRERKQPDVRAKDEKGKGEGEGSGWFRKLGVNKEKQPPLSRCVVIGPTAAGKTQLLSSLRRCIMARSHSYARSYTVSFGVINDEFAQLDEKLKVAYFNGLKLEATEEGKCFIPKFTLRLTTETGWPQRTHDTTFETFEGAGGLLEKPESRKVRSDAKFLDCREKLQDALHNCETVLICLPILGFINPLQEQELNEFIDKFLGRRRIRFLVVCLTMYEKLGINLGRNAYRTLATRAAARDAMSDALKRQLSGLDSALRQFSKRSKRQVWFVPVSSYGFVPYNGGANLSLLRDMHGNQDDALRTIPTPTDPDLLQHIPERPYSEQQAYSTYWRPFLTIDPFAFIATGDRTGTLIHSYKELHP